MNKYATCLPLVFAISACAKAPDAEDIKRGIEAELSCPVIKVVDVEKTNGIDRGDTYIVKYNYSVVLSENVANYDAWRILTRDCPFGAIILGEINFGIGLSSSANAGTRYAKSEERAMVKSENGWIFQ